MRTLAASLILCTVVSGLAAADMKSGNPKGFAPVNMTGTWEAQNEGFRARLRQDGEAVSGESANGRLAVRGGWSNSDLVLVVNWAPGNTAKCERSTLVVTSNGTVQRLPSMWFSKDGTRVDTLSRVSAEAAGAGSYPYAAELTACGDLTAYELTFESNKDALRGTSWPILDAVAGLLKTDPNLKLRVVGHTDSTGDAAANKALAQRRAENVRQKVLQRAAVDAGRVAATGLGAEQALQDNNTTSGRAANRRVEIAIVR
jgi:outer membrane protein OmpA-like peptidoglycan-associated protein